MPANGDENTELQADAGAVPQPPSTQGPALPADQADSNPKPAPADDTTILQPPADPKPPPTKPPGEKTEIAPTGPKTLPPLTEERTEDQNAPARAGQSAPGERRVPGYRMLQTLGSGTYGEVWLAEEERTGIRVAIKFLAHGTGLEWQLIQAEVKQLALLHADPGIVQLLDVELEANPPYYVMAYAEHGSLARRLEKGPLPLAEALEIFRQLAEALAYVHAKGVRHCDLKPGNILLNARNRILIADFGQAHLSSEATPALGTFFYMAPEQAALGRQIPDTRWDVYGLGAIFYAMLTGHPPREDAAARAQLAATPDLEQRLACYRNWVEKAPRADKHRRAPGIDRRLIEIIDRCLEIDPNRRLHDAGAVLAALARRERQRRQRPLLVLGFTAQVLLFVVLGGVATWAADRGLRKSEGVLVRQMLESDRVTAALVASGLEQELLTRKRVLERFAARVDLRAATAADKRDELQRLIREFNDIHAQGVLSWVIADKDGMLLAVALNIKPGRGAKLDGSFAWRDWFNGKGDQVDSVGKSFPPIERTHFSQPFWSRADERRDAEMVIGLSTPIFAPVEPVMGATLVGLQAAPLGEGSWLAASALCPSGAEKVIGVLCTPVSLREIHSWLDKVKIRNGFAVLIDSRGHCLRHNETKRITPPAGQNPPKWSSETFEAALREEGSHPYHLDPIDPDPERLYLASYAPLKQVGWAALVQHERSAALKPIDDLKTQLLYLGVALVVGVPLLVSGLWALLIWALRRKDKLAQN
ncbi:MAG TPA: serine/threonine protein kinase [Gemmataceae bacterium]|nr:serine/threonine protein kinase [Gemmataceae bacterium]